MMKTRKEHPGLWALNRWQIRVQPRLAHTWAQQVLSSCALSLPTRQAMCHLGSDHPHGYSQVYSLPQSLVIFPGNWSKATKKSMVEFSGAVPGDSISPYFVFASLVSTVHFPVLQEWLASSGC